MQHAALPLFFFCGAVDLASCLSSRGVLRRGLDKEHRDRGTARRGVSNFNVYDVLLFL
jgi:hypothetical protein